MYLKCLCGNILTDVASPNDVEHLLLSSRATENLQDLVDAEVEQNGEEQMWPEHWERAGSVDVWRCHVCQRLYLNARGGQEEVLVYRLEQTGLAR